MAKEQEDLRTQSEERKASFQSLYDETEKDIEGKRKSLGGLFRQASTEKIGGGYFKHAFGERVAAETLRVLSIVSMAAIVWMCWTLLALHEVKAADAVAAEVLAVAEILAAEVPSAVAGVGWEDISLRISATLALAVLAAYFARESSKHRQQYYAQLQTGLDLQALDP